MSQLTNESTWKTKKLIVGLGWEIMISDFDIMSKLVLAISVLSKANFSDHLRVGRPQKRFPAKT